MKSSDKSVKRILLAAPRSGSGKTMITCGLLNLLKEKGLDVTSFKCGPDYIDPMFHKKVLGIYGGNLDTFFCSHERVKEIFFSCGHDLAVIEGVMGIYDGIGGLSLEGSGYDIAAATDTPIILVVDGKGAGRSLVSTIKGILLDDTEHLIKGIILNRVTERFYLRLKPLLEKELLAAGFKVRLLGAVPELKDVHIDSRHLGLLRPDEISDIKAKIDAVSGALEKSIDIEALLELMDSDNFGEKIACHEKKSTNDDNDYPQNDLTGINIADSKLTLAVAMDDAFCFYYKENLKLLEKLGVSIRFFSPIKDEKLPEDIQGIYIGGGYPELHLKELSENISMRKSIKAAIERGIPSIAECGGFMYLHEKIESPEGDTFDMAGVVPGFCKKSDHLVRFGYVEINRDNSDEHMRHSNPADIDSSFAEALDGMKGHEFHYFDSSNNGGDMLIQKAGDEKKWNAMHVSERSVWGFPHMYFESKPEFVQSFVEAMKNVR
ncbi:MAG: cobyrinate a,c-diamide synthase [Butyrivibrio sp.]|nr:cobyrinate a,c-diamide synthase [Butyrivibrio sp.]